jgi:hypothetical protein
MSDNFLTLINVLPKEEREKLLKNLRSSLLEKTQGPISASNASLPAQVSSIDAIDKELSSFDQAEEITNASYDRRCLRVFLEENNKLDLHTWWDGTRYTIQNDWLFTDTKELVITLVNQDGQSKSFSLKISL